MEFLPLLVELQDEPIADNVCIPLYFLARLVKEKGTTVVQVGEGADENFLGYWWCEHYLKKALNVYEPARNGMRPKLFRGLSLFDRRARFAGGEDEEIRRRARNGQELFWGGAVCWWGDLRGQLTPDASRFASDVACPVAGLMPDDFNKQDSHAVVANYFKNVKGVLEQPEILQKIPYMELALRLPEHLLMRVDKMTMAHSVEARVPFLDHEVVEFAMRLPPRYKLHDGVGKRILKSVAEPYVDKDLLYRRKQGFGAPVDKWFREKEFGNRCIAALKRSRLLSEGYFDADYLLDLMDKQVAGRSGHGFHLWTVMNVVLWHERWVEGTLDNF
jgi:asparagine synthase (glutamine-hydrolysing)